MEREAQEHFIAGRLSEAADAFRALGRRHPERMDIQARIGYLALLDNDPDTAIAHLATAINQGLRTRDNLGRLAEAYYRKGDLGSAAYCFQRIGREGLAGTLAVLAEYDPCRLTEAAESVEIPWLTVDPLPTIEARVNDRVLNLVLNTGAGVTVIDTQIAVDENDALLGTGGGGLVQGKWARADWFRLDGIHRTNLDCVVLEDFPIEQRCGFPVHGLVGHEMLRGCALTLDFSAMHLCLSLPDQTASA